MQQALITGSLAYDHIMNFNGKFSDYILPDKIHTLNLSFEVDSMRRERGGCAANIAYNLSLLGEKPVIFGIVGEDFSEYKLWLGSKGIDTRFIREIYGELSSVGFGLTDQNDNQIWGYYPGAMKYADELSIKQILEVEKELPKQPPARFGAYRPASLRNQIVKKDNEKEEDQIITETPKLKRDEIGLLMISPNNKQAMMNLVHEAKGLNLSYIIDPGMQIPKFDDESILKAIDGAKVLIGNDYEIDLIQRMLNVDNETLLKLSEYVIITKGPRGSEILHKKERFEIPPAIPTAVVDPTGAGDAYRAGIIYGLMHKLTAEVMGKIGSLLAAYTVETHGTTTHECKIIEFKKRYQENFGEKLEL